ncbi:GDP-mannose 4,6-dehydratase [hydrothermal vent metagenome]|uniref:GDP-mannose 4,6-dehydratase n=1 Tax=hydrothermal vent metagenome TaxID=652676 RepID=A0A3B1B955_9ZZZZ
MRILVTGAGGFVGGILAEQLAHEENVELFGAYYNHKPDFDFPFSSFKLDIGNFDDVKSLISEIQPDEVYHLAGVSFISEAIANPIATYKINTSGPLNLLEAIAKKAPKARALIISSSDVYGRVAPSDNPVKESQRAEPHNIYSASKRCAELVTRQFVNNGLHVIIARPFNHTGPGQNERFVAPAFAFQIARIEAGLQAPVVTTGSLDAQRDVCDARDVARAYSLLMRGADKGSVYNVCSGKPVKIKKILDILLSLSTHDSIEHRLDISRSSHGENNIVYGDGSGLYKLAGWEPQIPLEKTLADLLDYCRKVAIEKKTVIDYIDTSS